MTPTADDYARAFAKARSQSYPQIDAFEQTLGYALDTAKLENAARILACPVKAHGANWQHGRVLYAAARKYLAGKPSGCWTFLDIGTAKGFSALCLQWALNDHAGGAMVMAGVVSLDVLDPLARVRRNTVAEVGGYLTLAETLAPWPEAASIEFRQETGIDWLRTYLGQVHIAYVDGKHTFDVVAQEAKLLAEHQEPGDLAIFDDAQIDGVAKALDGAKKWYSFQSLILGPLRAYAIGVRRG